MSEHPEKEPQGPSELAKSSALPPSCVRCGCVIVDGMSYYCGTADGTNSPPLEGPVCSRCIMGTWTLCPFCNGTGRMQGA